MAGSIGQEAAGPRIRQGGLEERLQAEVAAPRSEAPLWHPLETRAHQSNHGLVPECDALWSSEGPASVCS